VAMRTLDLCRPSVGAFAVGMAAAALDQAVTHAGERRAFGRPIADFQAVSHTLADMATRTQAARLLVYDAARAYDEGRTADLTQLAALAKLYATATAQLVVDAPVRTLAARALTPPNGADPPTPAGVTSAPGPDGFDASGLAGAVAAAPVPVVAVEPGNLRKAGLRPEATRLATAGARVLYGRGPDTARHALLFLA